jgi:hypothetical protein
MKNIVIIAALLVFFTTGAEAQTSSGYSGGQNASTPNPVATAPANTGTSGVSGAQPSTATPVAPAVPVAAAPAAAPTGMTTTAGTPPEGAKTTDTQKVDPCFNYMYDLNAYRMCTDRQMKLQRLKDAKAARDKSYEKPAPVAAAATAPNAAAPGAPAAAPATTPATAPATTAAAPANGAAPPPAPVTNTTTK